MTKSYLMSDKVKLTRNSLEFNKDAKNVTFQVFNFFFFTKFCT